MFDYFQPDQMKLLLGIKRSLLAPTRALYTIVLTMRNLGAPNNHYGRCILPLNDDYLKFLQAPSFPRFGKLLQSVDILCLFASKEWFASCKVGCSRMLAVQLCAGSQHFQASHFLLGGRPCSSASPLFIAKQCWHVNGTYVLCRVS